MENKQYSAIAQKLNLSKSTVTKAIRHCSGVDSATRQLVLNELSGTNFSPHHCDIYCILPDVPKYFWSEVRRGLEEHAPSGYSCKLNIFTKLSDEETVLVYLEEAEYLQPSVLILSANLTDKILQKLRKMTSNCLVILLSQEGELTNSFFVGANSYDDGYTLGRLCCNHYRPKRIAVLTLPKDQNASVRAQGFCQAVSERLHDCTLLHLAIDRQISLHKLAASHLALTLAPYIHEIDCIYSPIGNPALPAAVKKLNVSRNITLLCHDVMENTDSCNSAWIDQDIYTQGKQAMMLAAHFLQTQQYPVSKHLYIPSLIRQPAFSGTHGQA